MCEWNRDGCVDPLKRSGEIAFSLIYYVAHEALHINSLSHVSAQTYWCFQAPVYWKRVACHVNY